MIVEKLLGLSTLPTCFLGPKIESVVTWLSVAGLCFGHYVCSCQVIVAVWGIV